ncbi:magnesium transporter CorA family protein [Phyllobacterium leguminum]|uniref:Magnesium transport protein CorA n=1 Tax=Phyllobacterium leguminum TaxID=314237 RepID=A0A318TAG7_9HYPH|nr:magnesium transporter CorA family protein [Phyllobacterium leguminum]PYE85308.1 magnesium transporter [Phyllobacterium leguminum]
MIKIYCLDSDHLILVQEEAGSSLPANSVWIDLIDPTAEEEKAVEKWIGVNIPTRADMVEIEESSRFYMENGVQYLTAPILYTVGTEQRMTAPISFVLAGKLLVTVRYTEPKAFAIYIERAMKPGNGLVGAKCSGLSVLLGLVEAATDRLADILEAVSEKIETESQSIFHLRAHERPMTNKDFRLLLTHIGRQGAFLSKVRESLAGISRLLVYVTANMPSGAGKDKADWIKSLGRDTVSLENYVDFLSNKINFLLDTVVGLISVEQNAIIKIFSVAAVGFMPPTLIASIYGMNFHFMPELKEIWGYPLALLLMVVSALLPLVYFRKKGWL